MSCILDNPQQTSTSKTPHSGAQTPTPGPSAGQNPTPGPSGGQIPRPAPSGSQNQQRQLAIHYNYQRKGEKNAV